MSKKILVVDDEPDYLKIIKQSLTDEGYKVITASDGGDALEKVRNDAPDLMVLDISMPVMDGYEVCREIRKDAIYKNLPIIFLTVMKEREDMLKGLKLGSDEYLTKPFRAKELTLRIKKLLKS